ncbi:MAG: M48 family metalloprotease [Candidatus Omnitrophota bacterium]|nr:MAG: M48 family metalloprotease [Candidatus Omnitrophota bacterium]
MKKVTILAIIATLLTGCASLSTFNPATGEEEFIIISTASEVNMGKNVHSEIIRKHKLSDDEAKIDRLTKIGRRLAKVSDRQDYGYNFYLLKEDTINAFTGPGGNIYCFSGLYDKLETDDEIAAVLGHEMGHCAAKHVVKRIQATLGYNIISTLIYTHLKIEEKNKKHIAYAANSIVNLIMLGYGREDEYMADRLGIKYMYRAGYDPEATIKVLEMLKEDSKGQQGPVILRSHPYLDERIMQNRIEIKRVETKYKPLIR